MKKILPILILFPLVLSCGAQCPGGQGAGVDLGLCGSSIVSLAITPASVSLSLNQTQQLQATSVFSSTGPGTTGDFNRRCISNWSSANTSVATVSATGLVTSVGAGTTTVSCTYPGSSCAGGNPCTGSSQITGLSPPVFSTPLQQTCAQPCALTQALGPPSAVAYNYQLQGTGSNNTPYTYSITVGTLPSGLSLTGSGASAGLISGTPLAVGTSTFTAQVCDTIPACNAWQMSIAVVANNNSFYPLSTTSSLSQNKVAGQNSNYPTSLWGSAAVTNVSVTSNIVTITVANSFSAGSGAGTCTFGGTCGVGIGLGGFSNSSTSWLNGLILGPNSSTTGTNLVGPVFNKQGVQVTHANVGSTADTTGYMQGPGWQMFVNAPAPFPGSTNCTTGNPCPGQTGALTSADINTCGFDYSILGANGGPNPNSLTMWTNSASTSGVVYHPSKSSETYDELISYPDALGGYFVPFVSSTIFLGHAHYSATGCNGKPMMVLDTPTPSEWLGTNAFGLAISQLLPPANNQAVGYFVDVSSPFDPKLTKQTYQYSATGCGGGPCVTLLSSTILADIPSICPAWGFTTIGPGVQYAKAITIGSTDGVHDTDLNFALGAGPQNQLAKNMEFHIYNMNSTPKCENWDTAGRSGTQMYNDGTTGGLFTVTQGSGYKVNDVISFNSGSSCVGTVTVTGITGTGGVKLTGGLGLPTMTTNSGCVLGAVLVTSGGSGTGLGLQVSGVGVNATPCCMNVWPSGATSPTSTTLYTYGIHGGTLSKGSPIYIANSGYGNTTQKTCASCDNVYWQTGTTTLKAQTSSLVAGHPAVGVTHRGTSTSPPYTVSLWSDPTCTPSTNCVQIATLPSCPGGTINHSSWPSSNPLTDAGPITITSMQNLPGTPAQTNPANCTTGFGFSIWAADQTGTPRWFTHSYENTNNFKTEDGNGTYVEMICSPDRVFCVIPTDMNFGFTNDNVGCGTSSSGAPFPCMFALTLN